MNKKVNVAHKFTKSKDVLKCTSVAVHGTKKFAKVSVIDLKGGIPMGYTLKQLKGMITLGHERLILEAMEQQECPQPSAS